ncbi:MAG: metallophosphoesterase [Bdellovibrionales bacterium]|nr:metallophosphoesterase [Bdellovibrionales bacterium]
MVRQKLLVLLLAFALTACAKKTTLQGTVDKVLRLKERVILAGDGGDPDRRTFRTLLENASFSSNITTLVLLGDNVYPDGIPESEDSEEEQRFNDQLKQIKQTKASLLIVPGNHDWGPRDAGLTRLKKQHSAVKGWFGRNIMLPEAGCPGPAVRDIEESFVLVAIDSEAILRQERYPEYCANKTLEEVAHAIEQIGPKKNIIFLSHHPLVSFGPNSKLTDHCPMRMSCPRYQEMIRALSAALSKNPPLLCAAGHDHTLQIIKGDSACRNYIVSGALGELHQIDDNERLRASSDRNGFLLLEKYKRGKIQLSIIDTSADNLEGEAFTAFDLN